MGLLSWWTNWKRKRLRSGKCPEAWDVWLNRLWFYPNLDADQRRSLIATVKILKAEKNWEGCGGLRMTDEIRVTIAAQVGWLVCGQSPQYFDRVQSILVYPDAYVAPGMNVMEGGVVLVGDSHRQGEAWYRGPVILSWDEVRRGGYSPNNGHNLVLHEFAHQLDMLNGRNVDGVPPIEEPAQAERWLEVMEREYDLLVNRCNNGMPALLDCYGATSREEFFAVATEYFFQLPDQLRNQHNQLYEILANYYFPKR